MFICTVLSAVIAADDGHFICCSVDRKCVRVTNSFSIWLSDAKRNEIQSNITRKKSLIISMIIDKGLNK